LVAFINGFELTQNVLRHSECFNFFIFDCLFFLLILRSHTLHHVLTFVHFLNLFGHLSNLVNIRANHCVVVHHLKGAC
jgi:hypothetical protein